MVFESARIKFKTKFRAIYTHERTHTHNMFHEDPVERAGTLAAAKKWSIGGRSSSNNSNNNNNNNNNTTNHKSTTNSSTRWRPWKMKMSRNAAVDFFFCYLIWFFFLSSFFHSFVSRIGGSFGHSIRPPLVYRAALFFLVSKRFFSFSFSRSLSFFLSFFLSFLFFLQQRRRRRRRRGKDPRRRPSPLEHARRNMEHEFNENRF